MTLEIVMDDMPELPVPKIEAYIAMNTHEKVTELSHLRLKSEKLESALKKDGGLPIRRERLTAELRLTHSHIAALELMQDVAEQEVLNDDKTRYLLADLKKIGDIPYQMLAAMYEDGKDDKNLVVYNRLQLLRRARLIMFEFPDQVEMVVRLTERGRNFEYT